MCLKTKSMTTAFWKPLNISCCTQKFIYKDLFFAQKRKFVVQILHFKNETNKHWNPLKTMICFSNSWVSILLFTYKWLWCTNIKMFYDQIHHLVLKMWYDEYMCWEKRIWYVVNKMINKNGHCVLSIKLGWWNAWQKCNQLQWKWERASDEATATKWS